MAEVTALPVFLRPKLENTFRAIYRRAQARLCVSPYMEADYSERYGVNGTVLYPSRSADCPNWSVPPERTGSEERLRVAFAGTINSGATVDLLRLLSAALKPNDEFVIFGPYNGAFLKDWKIDAPNVKLGGLLAPADLLSNFAMISMSSTCRCLLIRPDSTKTCALVFRVSSSITRRQVCRFSFAGRSIRRRSAGREGTNALRKR